MVTLKLRWLSSTAVGVAGDGRRMDADDGGLGWLGGLLIGVGEAIGADENAGSLALTAGPLETELASGLADEVGATVLSAAGLRAAMLRHECTPMTTALTSTTLTALAAIRANWRRCPPTSANSSSGMATSYGRPGKRRQRPFGCQTCVLSTRPSLEVVREKWPATATLPSVRSLWSENSILSICSQDSILWIGSAASVASFASLGSFASIGSIGSAMSAFSLLSHQSTGSALSHE